MVIPVKSAGALLISSVYQHIALFLNLYSTNFHCLYPTDQSALLQDTRQDQKIDVVLSDYCMPEITGYDLLKAVKENRCSRSMPVVMMSSENDSQRISRCLATGAEDFLLKPLQVKDMQRLRNHARPTCPAPSQDSKRKLPVDLMAESNGSDRHPHLAGVAVA